MCHGTLGSLANCYALCVSSEDLFGELPRSFEDHIGGKRMGKTVQQTWCDPNIYFLFDGLVI